jgi:uracil-DNA glycosylase
MSAGQEHLNQALSFPFGQPIVPVVQRDRTPKRVFVLGVYASAVHARWLDSAGRTLINAVAVAPEPEIFWRGEGAAEIIDAINRTLPQGAGKLVPAGDNLNGPSGRCLDNDFLAPLRVARSETWLCDLLPQSRRNDSQKNALKREYLHRMGEWSLPTFEFPKVPVQLADDARRDEIVEEVLLAKPDVLITLGDMPLRWFARHFGARAKLASYGQTFESYGHLHDNMIAGHAHRLLPLVHPRQAVRLGAHSEHWSSLHRHWRDHVAPQMQREFR